MNKYFPERDRKTWEFLQNLPCIYSLEQYDKNELIKMAVGSLILSYVLDTPPKDLEEWTKSFVSLDKYLDKNTAIQLINNLPLAITNNVLKYGKYGIFLQDFYRFLSQRLLTWELNIPMEVNKNWLDYEGFAILSRNRYQLIMALWERDLIDKNIFQSPFYVWLLAESAVCLKIINNQECRETNYRNGIKHLKYLNDVFQDNNWGLIEPKNIDEFVKNFDLTIEEKARDFAKQDVKFDENYYAPYCKSLKNWNSFSKNSKNLQHYILEPRKHPKPRGRNLNNQL